MIAALTTLLGLFLPTMGEMPLPVAETSAVDDQEVLDEHGRWPKPTELFDVVRVVDGDTVHIQRGGEKVKLRLLSVDTEEKLSFNGSASKPGTVFGEETSQWAEELFAELGDDPKIGLRFPNGIEANDVYGRLLCHVVMPDGTDFNVLLVELGKSPYFNKYGNSRIAHGEFVEAQRLARNEKLGIWNPGKAQTDAKGTYSIAVPDAIYPELLVEAAGFASRWVPVPRGDQQLDRSTDLQGSLEMTLNKPHEQSYDPNYNLLHDE